MGGAGAHCSVFFVVFDVARPATVLVRVILLNLTVGFRGTEQRMILFLVVEALGMGGGRELATLAPDHGLVHVALGQVFGAISIDPQQPTIKSVGLGVGHTLSWSPM